MQDYAQLCKSNHIRKSTRLSSSKNEMCTRAWGKCIMEYGSTPYIGMAPKKMAVPLHVYKVMCSKLCARFCHKLLWTIPVILECFHQ